MAIVDHIQEALDHLIIQYKESQTVEDYLTAVLIEANELEQVFCDLILKRFIDTAVGEQLDIIGSIVGQPRTLIDAALLVFFGFVGAPASEGFISLEDPTGGARFRILGESDTGNIILSDEDYRLFIRARIIKNNTRATHEEIIEMVIFILSDDVVKNVTIQDGDRAYIVNIGGVIDENQQSLISNTDLMPKPIGIKVTYGVHDPDDFFEFASIDDPVGGTGGGFSSIADPLAGGTFSKLIF